MEKFTKGEWHLPHFARKTDEQSCDCGFLFAGESGSCLGTLYYESASSIGEYPSIDEAIANAKLIVSAPSLLLELKNSVVSIRKLLSISNLAPQTKAIYLKEIERHESIIKEATS